MQSYLFIISVCIIAWVFGRRILFHFRFHNGFEEAAFCIGLGLGVIIFDLMILGLLQILYQSTVIISFLILLWFSRQVFTDSVKRIRDAYTRSDDFAIRISILVIGSILVLTFLSPILKLPLYPPTGHDPLTYHLPLAKYYVKWHGIREATNLRWPVFPVNLELLFTLTRLFGQEIGPHLIHFMCMLLSAVALIGWGTRIQSVRAGFWAAVLAISSPQIFMEASIADIDQGLSLFWTLGIYALVNWIGKNEINWLVLSAVFFGIAAGTKYTSLVVIFIAFLITVIFDIRDRKLRYSPVFALLTFLVGCPWYVRNLFYTGNPFTPFMGNIFGYHYWNADDLARQIAELRSHGTARNFEEFYKMPWTLMKSVTPFVENYPLSKYLLYALAPAIILGNFKSQTRWVLIFVFLFYSFWFIFYQVLRYLDPIIPAYCLTAAVGADLLIGWIPYVRNKYVSIVLAFWIAGIIFSPAHSWAKRELRNMGSIPVTSQEIDRFYKKQPNRRFMSMDIFKHLNQKYGDNYRLYALDDHLMFYFAEGDCFGDVFGEYRKSNLVRTQGKKQVLLDAETIYNFLKEKNIEYLSINFYRNQTNIPTDPEFQKYFQPEVTVMAGSRPHAILYKLID